MAILRKPSFWQVNLRKLYTIDKADTVEALFFLCMALLYFGSLHPWFMWPMKDFVFLASAALAVAAFLIDNSRPHPALSTSELLLPSVLFLVLSLLIVFINDPNPGYILTTLGSVVSMLLLLRGRGHILQRFCDWLTRAMATFMVVSILFFVLYLAGFPLPSRPDMFNNYQYSFQNYYLFMVNDASLFEIVPRFQSVFLEPGHLGTAVVMLLMTQFGRWRRWYNVVLLFTAFISFSLAAYALLLMLIFLNLWVQRKHIIGKVLVTMAAMAVSVIVVLNYNGGNNLVNDLILLRLEVDDKTGTIVGNNRVTEDFEKEFDSYITTTDIFFGRDMKKASTGFGNSGYRVFIYENGIVATLLVLAFYIVSLRQYRDYRFFVSAMIILAATFWIRGYPLWYSYIIPIFVTALQDRSRSQPDPDTHSLPC
ncbi:MAG: hypothetical protein K5928_04180 [Prevotella sp.]|nr:hypothetical protein [Prevotella sp.]